MSGRSRSNGQRTETDATVAPEVEPDNLAAVDVAGLVSALPPDAIQYLDDYTRAVRVLAEHALGPIVDAIDAMDSRSVAIPWLDKSARTVHGDSIIAIVKRKSPSATPERVRRAMVAACSLWAQQGAEVLEDGTYRWPSSRAPVTLRYHVERLNELDPKDKARQRAHAVAAMMQTHGQRTRPRL